MVLPSYFEHLKEAGDSSGLQPFTYDASINSFLVSDKRVPAESFDPYVYNPYELGLEEEGLGFEEISRHSLIIPSFGRVIATPKFHSFIKENPKAVGSAINVMKNAYSKLGDIPEGFADEEVSYSHLGFAAGFLENGDLRLQVLGNCACLGPTPHGNYLHDKYENNFAEYDLHNADTQAQRTSLYAGLGHMAFIADGLQPAQQALFS